MKLIALFVSLTLVACVGQLETTDDGQSLGPVEDDVEVPAKGESEATGTPSADLPPVGGAGQSTPGKK